MNPGRNFCLSAIIFSTLMLLSLSLSAADTKYHPGLPQDVLTYHGDSLRTGWFSSETQLNVTNVNPQSFGLLHTVTLDARVDAEPLYVYQLTSGKLTYNVAYVVTENNSVYAIDADKGKILWHRNFGPAVPYQYKNNDDNVYPIMGILSTPVIDRTAGLMYFVSDGYNGKVDGFFLHAISLITGKNTVTPAFIHLTATLSNGTKWTFNPRYHLQRPGLLEANGSIYVAFGSNGDTQPDQSRGNILRYDATTLAFQGSDVTNRLKTATSYYLSSIWQSGYGIASDTHGDIYFSTGNSDSNTPSYDVNFNRPDSMVHLSSDLSSLLDSFTTSNYFQLDQGDVDVGSGGMMILPDQPGSIPHLAVSGGKDGREFLMNRDNLGGYTQGGPDNVLQAVNEGGCWCGPAYFVGPDGNPYVVTGGGNGITTWQLQTNGQTPQLVLQSSTGRGAINGLPDNGGSVPVISSNGTTAGTAIAWFVQKPSSSSDSDPGTPLTLRAYDATNLNTALFSAQGGTWVHAVNSNANIVPTVANGHVYVASNKQLNIFGLLPPRGSAERASLPKQIAASKLENIDCAPSESAQAAIKSPAGSHQFYGTVCKVDGSNMQLSLRSHRSITVDVSQAFTSHREVLLTLGRAIHVQATVDAKGSAHALRISPSHTLSAETPADR
jgi:hypothetical protein